MNENVMQVPATPLTRRSSDIMAIVYYVGWKVEFFDEIRKIEKA